MVFLYIILLVGIAFLILERQRFFAKKDSNENLNNTQHLESNSQSYQNHNNSTKKDGFFGIFSGNYFQRDEFKNNNSTNLIPCESCGKYVPQDEITKKDNKNVCKECAK
ncbi:hypothetical protein DCO58_03615 [Helicobacter saguini]|uniref:Uncharacterized protein n=1 Tax=Helicobacter saguini TaxID=1548018 RepID=A0A347VSD9_9HELI|nr:hypothetical protein [Helicobacter saguini]MWV62546.1 hypothetical protein [Helicobacter saguini]MWV66780.1 hypothetical protein [Helicobacter saguini]MWV69131.1 hypothetical protein [Helicobacter saguini]MWV71314.1 hypothetical protein [Helicobacter saguini]TLD94175.1 hypothetical protein LS64_006635 [Helicobacter saguini]